MKTKRIIGQIVSRPQVLMNENYALVLFVVKSNEGYKELHYNKEIISATKTLAWNFANTKFSTIATSSIGETIEVEIYNSTGEIIIFKNVTRGDEEFL